MSGLPDLDATATWRAIVVVAALLAASHAYLKLSPYFCTTWFGAGLLFGWRLADDPTEPAAVVLPVVVVYLAAALTKGLVETRKGVRGNHLVHVLMTGVLSAVVALPLVSAAEALGWPLPRTPDRELLGVDAAWLGGVTLDAAALWAIVGVVFYGTYKVLDHVGLNRAIQTVAVLAAAPFLAPLVVWLHAQM